MFAALLLPCAAALSVPAPTAQGERPAVIEGRVLLPDGAPAAGATWTLEGRPASPEREREFGVPDAWRDLSGEVSVHGLVRARFEPDSAFEYVLTITLDGHATETRRWRSIAPGTTTTFEDVRLRATGSLSGTVVNVKGDPLTGTAWTIRAEDARPAARIDERRTRVSVEADPETGRFTIDGLLPGPVDVRLFDLRIGSSDVHRADVRAGRRTALDLVVPELALFRDRIVVSFADAHDPFAPGPDPAHVWLVGEDGERRNPVRLERKRPGTSRVIHAERLDVWRPRSPPAWVFERVGEGTFTLEVDDPKFDAWAQDDARAGAAIAARLRGSAAIRIDARDAAGEPAAPTEVEFTHGDVGSHPDRFRARHVRGILDGGLVDDIVPGDYSIRVFAQDATGLCEVVALEAGETRVIEVRLTADATVRGRVDYVDGSPASGVLVRLVTPAEVGDSPRSFVWSAKTSGSNPERARHERTRSLSDSSGAFELAVEEPGRYLVLAGDHGAPVTECAVFDTAIATPPQTLALEIDPGGYIEGRVRIPDGLDPRGRRVSIANTGHSLVSSGRAGPPLLDRDGRFRVGPLRPGRVELSISWPGRMGWSSGGTAPLGSCEVVSGETTTVTFDYPSGSLALIAFDLTPTELGEVEVRAGILRQSRGVVRTSFTGTRRANASAIGNAPRIGPLEVGPGTYDLWFAGEGWAARVPNLRVDKGELRTDVLDLDRWKRRVRFLSGGQPLAKKRIVLFDVPEELGIPVIETDEDGRALLDLGAGEYRFRILAESPRQAYVTATVDWPLGEGVEDIVFR